MSGMTKAKSGFNLHVDLVAGAGASTNIAITGIATTDTLLFVGHITTAAAVASMVDDTANCSITSAGNIQSVTVTSTDQLWVWWIDNSA